MDGEFESRQAMQRQVLAAMRRIIRAIDLYSRQLLDECGLTGPQLALLEVLHRGGSVPAGELARRLQVGQPTVTGIVERLEKRGLLTRTRDGEDRRTVNVAITEEGVRLVAAAPPVLQKRFCEKLAMLADWEQTQLLATLQRIAAMMEATDVEAAPYLVTGPEFL